MVSGIVLTGNTGDNGDLTEKMKKMVDVLPDTKKILLTVVYLLIFIFASHIKNERLVGPIRSLCNTY
jgi:hypothetical protein